MKAATAKLPMRDFPSPAGGFNKGLGELSPSQASQLPPEELKDAIILDGETKPGKDAKDKEKGAPGAEGKDGGKQPPALRLEDRPLEEPGGKGKSVAQPPTAPPSKEAP